MDILRFSGLPVRPWKNGAGTARVIAEGNGSESADPNNGDVDWYVGIADITQAAPFSPYPGMDRRLMQLDGSPIALRCRSPAQGIDFTHRIEAPLVEFAFQGDWETSCTFDAIDSAPKPARVLNVMTRRLRMSATTEVIRISGTLPIQKGPSESLVVIVAAGSVRTMADGAQVQPQLGHFDALLDRAQGYGSISFSPAGFGAAQVVVVRIHPLESANS